jgi:vancomycin resistance protein YoaR
LLANLKIVKRQNHSMPVAYVPVGRDATVDYGVIDLVLENNYDTPIAITSEYKPGRLIFRVLGTKDPNLSVKLVTEGHKTWETGMDTVVDRTLAPGRKKVVEKGSRGHSIQTYRLVYSGDKLVARESLGKSFYKGAKRIVAIGARPLAPAPETRSAIPASAPLGNPN